MNSIDLPSSTGNNNRQQQLHDLFSTLTGTTREHVRALDTDIFTLDPAKKQALISRVNQYVRFEFDQHTDLHDTPLHATGTGMLLLSDDKGNVLSVEALSDDMEITGTLSEMCAFPVPTLECILACDGTNIPVTDEVLSPIIILKDGFCRTDYDPESGYQNVYDFSNYQVCLPLAHRLTITDNAAA